VWCPKLSGRSRQGIDLDAITCHLGAAVRSSRARNLRTNLYESRGVDRFRGQSVARMMGDTASVIFAAARR
jgi:spore maturation protein SpmB